MAVAERGEVVARLVVLFIAVAAFNNLRRGELTDWFQAKAFNANEPPPSGQTPLAKIFDGLTSATGGVVSGIGETAGGILDGFGSSSVDLGAAGAEAAVEAALVTVGSTRMSHRFAARWVPMAAAAKADGITLDGGAYRSHAEQKALYEKNCKGGVCNPPTAKPGHSRHETGDAIDVDNCRTRSTANYKWLAANAGRFGIKNLPSEAWHWSIDGK